MEKSSFFNSQSHDRRYSAQDFAMFYGDLFSNGVFYEEPTSLRVEPDGGMNINVLAGSAWINGYRYFNTGTLPIELTHADGIYTRIDRVVIRWDLSARAIYCAILQGTPSATPVARPLTRISSIFEISIADIHVRGGVGAIVEGDITDNRLNPTLCGTCRTRGFLNYGEADTEALIRQFAEIRTKVNILDDWSRAVINGWTYHYTVPPNGSWSQNPDGTVTISFTMQDERFNAGGIVLCRAINPNRTVSQQWFNNASTLYLTLEAGFVPNPTAANPLTGDLRVIVF